MDTPKTTENEHPKGPVDDSAGSAGENKDGSHGAYKSETDNDF